MYDDTLQQLQQTKTMLKEENKKLNKVIKQLVSTSDSKTLLDTKSDRTLIREIRTANIKTIQLIDNQLYEEELL